MNKKIATDLSPAQLVEYLSRKLTRNSCNTTNKGDRSQVRATYGVLERLLLKKNAAQFAIRVQTKRISARTTRMERGEEMTVSTKVGCQGNDDTDRRETKRMDELVVVTPNVILHLLFSWSSEVYKSRARIIRLCLFCLLCFVCLCLTVAENSPDLIR